MSEKLEIIISAKDKNVSRVLKKITVDMGKVGDATKKTAKSSKAASEATKDLGKSFGNLKNVLAGAAGITAALVGFGFAAKKAFDMAKQGAAIQQTEMSFEALNQRIGGHIDVLQQMRDATLGTVDDMTLMKSALTLTAGATGGVERALALAMPKIAEIAKAANKLNPTLGSTTFQMESLATAAKRSSLMIADNAGLIIKMETAVQKVHPALQSLTTVYDELTSQQKFLNEMLFQGGNLIDQVGGEVDSAEDSFAQFETTIKNTSDALKKSFYPAIEKTMSGFNQYLSDAQNVTLAHELLNDAWRMGAIRVDQMMEKTGEMARDHANSGEVIAWVTEQIGLYDYALSRTNQTHDEAAYALGRVNWNYYRSQLAGATNATESLTTAAGGLIKVLPQMDGAFDDAGGAAGKAAKGAGKFGTALGKIYDEWRGILTLGSLESKIGGFWEELKYDGIGAAADIETAMSHIEIAYEAGDIGLDLAQELTLGAGAAAAAAEHEMGELTFTEASQKLADAFGIGADRAAQLIRERIGGQSYTIYIDAIITSVSQGGHRGYPGGFDWGDLPAEPTQHGGPVDEGKPYIVGEVGPELFVPNQSGTVIPNNQISYGGNEINIEVNVESMASDIDIHDMAWELAREIQASI